MTQFTFTKTKIEEYVEKIGVEVRPIIDHKLEDQRMYHLYQDLVEHLPLLFESLLKSPVDLQIRKKLVFLGKGEVDAITLVITQKGPVFMVPRKLSIFDEETSFGDITDIAHKCIDIFKKNFPHKTIRRVGHVNEYIFALGSESSVPFVANRFTRLTVPPNGEIELKINRPTDDYNRIIQLRPVFKKQMRSNIDEIDDVKAYGLKVMVDFNNRDMNRNLDNDDIRAIIQSSIEYNEKDLYAFLNGFSEEE